MQDTDPAADDGAKLTLPSILDLNAAPQLQQSLAEACKSGKTVIVDASAVERISSLCLQMLASARASVLGGAGFKIPACSAAVAEMASGLALSDALGLAGDSNA